MHPWLIVKEDKFDAATAMFQGTEINITTQGKDTLEQHWVQECLLRNRSNIMQDAGLRK